jgi:hypothetical protein
MPNQPYFPKTEPERIIWLSNYLAKLIIYGAICGLSEAEIAATQRDITSLIWILQVWLPAMRQGSQSATAFRTQAATGTGTGPMTLPSFPVFTNVPPMCRPGVLTHLFKQVGRMKLSDAYNDSIGRDLGIIGAAGASDLTIPDLTASVEQGNGQQSVVLNYTKHGHDGAHIESRRNGGDWELLAININKPHIDTRPLLVANTPEVREFRLRRWDKGEAVGEFSPVAKVTVSP